MSKYIQIENWATFQHYKDRDPPWIKLHRSLLLKYEFQCLQDDSKLLLMLLWLLASQLNNKIPADIKYLKENLHIKKVSLQPLIDSGFITCYQDDSNPIADCEQSAMLEAEAEAYKKEAEKSKKKLFGQEFQKVKLTENEFAKLTEKFGDRTALLIDNLDSALASKGYKYSSHYATILNWERRDSKRDAMVKKTLLFPIPGKNCEKCGIPAVWKCATGAYDHCYCLEHSPQAVQDKYRS